MTCRACINQSLAEIERRAQAAGEEVEALPSEERASAVVRLAQRILQRARALARRIDAARP